MFWPPGSVVDLGPETGLALAVSQTFGVASDVRIRLWGVLFEVFYVPDLCKNQRLDKNPTFPGCLGQDFSPMPGEVFSLSSF